MSIQKIRELSTTDEGLNLIKEYKNGLPIRKISKKYNVSRSVIKDLLQYNNIQIKRSFLIQKNKKIFESDIGKNIVNEYQKSGNNLRSLERKYNLSRKTISIILKHANIKLKTCNEARQEQIKLGLGVGKNHPNFGKAPSVGAGQCRWYFYEGKTYQGSWEFKFGLWLIQQNKRFYCHEHVRQFTYQINNIDHTYCPDFYLIDDNIFVEVKGYFKKSDQQKMQIIKKLYPNEQFEIYDKNKLNVFDILDIDKKLNIRLDFYELDYTKDISLKKFIEIYEKDKIIIIKDCIINRLNLTKLAEKYNTTYRIIDQIYHLWIKDYLNDIEKFRQFVMSYCINDIISEYRTNCSLHKLDKKYKIKREDLNKILPEDAKDDRKKKQIEKYNENYGKHLDKVNKDHNLTIITDDIKKNILIDYQNNTSIRQICYKYNVLKKRVKKILYENNVQIKQEGFYTKLRHKNRNVINHAN